VAPAAILAPVLGGWLADHFGFGVLFAAAAAGGLATALVLLTVLKDPRQPAVGDGDMAVGREGAAALG
jgi:predicted MFS family arabinose efflux permease